VPNSLPFFNERNMIIINNFSIIENGSKLAIDVETDAGYSITSIRFWDMDSFKDYPLAIDGSYKIDTGTPNHQVLIYTAEELEVGAFNDIWFMEVESDAPVEDCATCVIPALAITYNLYKYYACSLREFLRVKNDNCTNCNTNINKGLITSINLLIDAVVFNIELGFYSDAIDNVHMLQKLCSINDTCVNCGTVECTTCGSFKQFNP